MLQIDYEGLNRNRIMLTKGDSAKLKLKLYDVQNKLLTLKEGDVAVLTIKQDIDSSDIVLQLVVDESQQFTFAPADTAELECGQYCYDIQVTLADGSVYTVIPPSRFIITKGVS